jgi:hypothetical protein
MNLQNPVGRIVNRFSKDQAMVDELLPSTAQVHVLSKKKTLSCAKYFILFGNKLRELNCKENKTQGKTSAMYLKVLFTWLG